MKNFIFLISLTALSATCFSEEISVENKLNNPHTDPSQYLLDNLWPNKNDLNDLHPPFTYDDTPSTLSRSIVFIKKDAGSAATGFFIKSNRSDGYKCLITAGHAIDDNYHDIRDGEFTSLIANNYIRTHGPRGVNFYIRSAKDKIVRSIHNDTNDIALLLINPNTFEGGSRLAEYDYDFVFDGMKPESPLTDDPEPFGIYGHPYGWPVNTAFGHETTVADHNRFEIRGLTSSVGPGSSGSPFFEFSTGTAIGVTVDRIGDRSAGINTLTSIIPEILDECEDADDNKTRYVYFVSTSAIPENVFLEGISSPGYNHSIYQHGTGESCSTGTSSFITTTSSRLVAEEWAKNELIINHDNQDSIYLYKIKASNDLYNLTSSLIWKSQQSGDGKYQLLAEKIKDQREYIAQSKIKGEDIISATKYSRGNNHSLKATNIYYNKDYKPLPNSSSSNPEPFKDDSDVVLNDRLFLVAAISGALQTRCFSSCSELREGDECPAENFMEVSLNQEKTKVYNPFLKKEMYTVTPWKTNHNQYNNAIQWWPDICQLSLDGNEYRFSCQSKYFDKAKILFGAGGSAYTWIDTEKEFKKTENSFSITYTNKDMPVLDKYGSYSGYNLDYWGYTMYDVFSGYYSSWWSNVALLPIYPNLPNSEKWHIK